MLSPVPKETPLLDRSGRLSAYWFAWLSNLARAVNAGGSSSAPIQSINVNGNAVAPVSGAINFQAGTNTTLAAAGGTITVNAQVTPAVWGPAAAGQTTWG